MKAQLLSLAFIFSCSVSVPAREMEKISFKREMEIAKPDLRLPAVRPLDKKKYFDDNISGRMLCFGYFDFDSKKLNDRLLSYGGTEMFDSHYMGIGIDNFSHSGHYDGISGLSFILPQTVSVGPNDSLELRLAGWHLTTSVLGYDIIKNETFAIVIAPSIAWGNLKMRREVEGQKTKYTNPFVAPGGRFELRLTLGKFHIGGRATYRYDITHSLWKRKDNLMPTLPTYKNNGLAFFGYIGLTFK
ncbi:MAG TPA: hypothetical protein VK826_20050 [Bacteroidia bacterium]|nr:hypothetical protein [Bacteroidia bacterium]